MRKTLTTAALMLALCCPTFAGEMHTGSPTPPLPQPASAVEEPADDATPDGEIYTPGLPDSLTQVALDLLAVLPSLL